jgi:hypothetical protein
VNPGSDRFEELKTEDVHVLEQAVSVWIEQARRPVPLDLLERRLRERCELVDRESLTHA